MSYNYTTYVADLANLLVIPSTDADYQTVLPNIIDDAEQRIYRDIDLLNTITRDYSAAFTTGTRTFNLPATNGTFYVVDSIYAITPFGTAVPDNGTRNELFPVSRPFLTATYPSSNGSTVPAYFAMTTQTSLIVGPWPDQAYQVEVVGTIRPAPLGSTNVTTLLTAYLPDLFIAASMVFGAAYLQNFGQSVDNPQMGVNWESHYQTLLKSAQTEESRKKFTGEGWSSKQPAPLATPPRT
ncbi:MAG: hypothetical protein WCD69_25450 [Xanthobacteraceae bacterium]